MPYCNFATIGLSDMKLKSFLLQVNGKGTMSSIKMVISATSRTNTCHEKKCQHDLQSFVPTSECWGKDRSINE